MTDNGHNPEAGRDHAEGIYLFCFARQNAAQAVGLRGPDDRSPVSQRQFKDIVAVLSKVPLGEWIGPSSEANLQDLSWVGPRACRHQEIIEQAMRYSSVLPARFGTIFSSSERLEDTFCSHYDSISEFLDYAADKEEWALKGLLDTAKAEDHLLARGSRSTNLPPSSGARYMMEKQLRIEAKRKMKTWAKTLSDTIVEELQPLAVESRALKTLSRYASGRELDVAFNWAFLLTCEGRDGFLSSVERLNDDYSRHGLELEISGPWPPYSFCPSLSHDKEPEKIE
ncbi:GvpL/GvpF family gas vesicle protein [Candidatus Poribacteria bacterium]|nr:GvpL/GvpF family gas vesicle protein [Candidatus Poribacteria bacterium]